MSKFYLFLAIGFVLAIIIFSKKGKKETFKVNNGSVLNTKLNLGRNEIDNDLRRKTKYVRLIYGRPNKCFSCEKEVLRNAGPKYIHYAFPSKCFSCEKGSKNPYMEGPTKCFSCDKEKNIY